MNKEQAARKKAFWLSSCIEAGWDKSQLDGLSDVWDKFRDEYGNSRPTIEGEKEDQDNQPLIMVEALNCYNELKSFDFSPARIVEEMISRFHITRINP